MRLFIAILFAWGLLLSPNTPAPAHAPADSVTLGFSAESEMTVYGSSNVRDWDMDVETINGDVTFEENETVPSIQTVTVDVPVEGLVAGRSSMQDKAHKALKKEEYPTLTFTSSDIEVSKSQENQFAVFAKGQLTIAGTTREVTLKAKGARHGNGSYTIEGEHNLKLSTFDVEPPTAMFGALTVADEIRLAFNVTLVSQ